MKGLSQIFQRGEQQPVSRHPFKIQKSSEHHADAYRAWTPRDATLVYAPLGSYPAPVSSRPSTPHELVKAHPAYGSKNANSGPPATQNGNDYFSSTLSWKIPEPKLRPVLKRNGSYGSSRGSNHHVAFMNPSRTEALHMHPLLASTPRNPAPMSYDIRRSPASRNILDRAMAPVPTHTLHQPATDPPTHTQLVLASEWFPWTVIAAKPSRRQTDPVTCLDVVQAVSDALMAPVLRGEWEALGQGSSRQKKVSRAFEKRVSAGKGRKENGVLRIDWLGAYTKFVGVEVHEGVGKLVFAKA